MKKGFTLIELLAVIVILAIIALIATPIVLGIIEDARNSADKESINMYGKAVKNAVARYSLLNPTDINITADEIKDYIEYDAKGNTVECNIIIKQDKTVVLNNCKINNKSVEYTYGMTKTKCEIVDTTNVSTEAIYNTGMIGNKVKCGSDYFYVIPNHSQAPAGTISLLAENNITLEATPVQSSTAGEIWFNTNRYWLDDTYENILNSYTLKKGFVYDSNSNLYKYVEAYKNYMISNGTNVIAALIPDHQQMISLGCRISESGSHCDYAEPWVISSSYWTGTIVHTPYIGDADVYGLVTKSGMCNEGSDVTNSWYSMIGVQLGIRPVIIINENDIKI